MWHIQSFPWQTGWFFPAEIQNEISRRFMGSKSAKKKEYNIPKLGNPLIKFQPLSSVRRPFLSNCRKCFKTMLHITLFKNQGWSTHLLQNWSDRILPRLHIPNLLLANNSFPATGCPCCLGCRSFDSVISRLSASLTRLDKAPRQLQEAAWMIYKTMLLLVEHQSIISNVGFNSDCRANEWQI